MVNIVSMSIYKFHEEFNEEDKKSFNRIVNVLEDKGFKVCVVFYDRSVDLEKNMISVKELVNI